MKIKPGAPGDKIVDLTSFSLFSGVSFSIFWQNATKNLIEVKTIPELTLFVLKRLLKEFSFSVSM